MADSPEAIKKSIRTYFIVFAVLILGTILTVAVAEYPPFDIGEHGFDKWDAILGLCIATFKASCVGAIFMHLNHEKKAVYWIFFAGISGAISLAALLAMAKSDPIHYDGFREGGQKEPAAVQNM